MRVALGIVLEAASPCEVVVALLEVVLAPGTCDPARICVVAVPDTGRESRLQLCRAEGFQHVAGAPVALYGSVAMTVDEARIGECVAPFLPGRCSCPGSDGKLVACP